MKRFCLIVILFLVGCTMILEKSNFDSLNARSGYNFPDKQALIHSCLQLKEESYDVFYTDENQKCLKENAQKIQNLSDKIDQTEDLIEKEKLLNDILASSEKFDACKITKELTVGNFNKTSDRWQSNKYWRRDGIIDYFIEAYQICENREYFDENAGNHIIADYKTAGWQKEENTPKIEKFSEVKREVSARNQRNKSIKEILSENNPLIRKMQQVAPDFIWVNVYECPIIFFVRDLKETTSLFYSDLDVLDNYKFKKKDADTLIVSAADFEFTFHKTGKDSADVIVVKDIDQWGNRTVSKNTLANNILVSSVCRGW